ncbi:MAG TPA: hypothetical protein VGJ00_03875 [Rhabdochlamydiaceae bacterium]|jgi:hypothetical protein
MTNDIVLEILNGLSDEDHQEISELSKPMVGDGVFSQERELAGLYAGGEIVEIIKDDDEPTYRIAWWDAEQGGYMKDTTVYERMDFSYFKDGKAGRTWYAL